MNKILFSITAHENLRALSAQIDNIRKFNDDSAVLVHLSANMKLNQNDIYLIKSLSNEHIIFNDRRIHTQRYKIASPQIVNIQFASKMSYEYLCMLTSNECFFRRGAYEYMKQYDAGSYKLTSNESLLNQPKHRDACEFGIKLSGIRQTYTGQHEGTFYKKHIAENIADCILNFCPIDRLHHLGDTTEEWILPTALHLLYPSTNIGYPVTLIRDRSPDITGSDAEQNMQKTIHFIETITKQGQFDSTYVVQNPINSIFSIKRVSRTNNNDPLLQYINQLT